MKCKLALFMFLALGTSLILAALPAAAAPAAAPAAPMPGPAFMLPKGQMVISLDGTWLAEQKFKRQDSYRYTNSFGSDMTITNPIWDFKIKNDQFYMLRFTYGVTDWLNAYVRAGVVTGGKLKDTRYSTFYGFESDTQKLKSDFVWGLGLKGRVWQFGPKGGGIVMAAQYLRYDNRKLDYEGGDMAGYITSDASRIDYWQVDASALFYWPFKIVTPYAGAAYTYSEAKYHLTWVYNDNSWEGADFTLKDKNNFMPIVGLFFPLGHHFSLDLKGEFVARTAGTLSLNYSF